MEVDLELHQLLVHPASPDPSPSSKLKRLKKMITQSHSPSPSLNPPPSTDRNRIEPDDSDGLDPLFSEGVKRVLEFSEPSHDADHSSDTVKETFPSFDGGENNKHEKKTKKRRTSISGGDKSGSKPKLLAKRKDKEERKAYLAQQADFQRIMRERKSVGFKSVPMVEKPISSVLEKIRKRKLELLEKAKAARIVLHNKFMEEGLVESDEDEDDDIKTNADTNKLEDSVNETSEHKSCSSHDRTPSKNIQKGEMELSKQAIASRSVLLNNKSSEKILDIDSDDDDCMRDMRVTDTAKFKDPVNEASQDKPSLSHYPPQSASKNLMVEKSEKMFRPPVDDTQDLFPDSQTSDSHSLPPIEVSGSPVEDVSPTLPSLNLEFDSALPDEFSSDEDESDKENSDPLLYSSRREKSAVAHDPVKEFLDEEALEDDSDNDLNFGDKDEENEAEMEEHCEYIATDFKENTVDHERRNELHQKWLQQQDEAGTENLLQKLKYGGEQQELSFLQEEDDDKLDDEEESESDDGLSEDDDTPPSNSRLTTKKLRQMIPQMFTDKDDGFVSSEDEETERSLSRQFFLQKKEQQSKFFSAEEDVKSTEVYARIKKLNVVPENTKRAKTSSVFEALLSKGSSSDSTKSPFLRRASSNSVPSSHRQSSSTGRSFIFGRDDSRSSIPIVEESNNLNQSGGQAKKTVSAKFSGSQVKWSQQQTQARGDKVAGTSLFEILKRSSVQVGSDNRDEVVDHQAIFAAFKTVKKQIKVVGRS